MKIYKVKSFAKINLVLHVTGKLKKLHKIESIIKKIEPDFNKNSKLFHSKKEVEDLYQNISKFALINGLSITNLKKGDKLIGGITPII